MSIRLTRLAEDTRRVASPRFLRAVVSGAVALALLAPSTALAWRDPADKVSGVPLSEGKIAYSSAPDIDAAGGILVSSDGHSLWSRGANARRPMASTTKMMTALLVLEHGGLGRTVTVSRNASRVAYGIGLRPGERMKVRKLLELALVASSNDAAYALGETVSGNMPAFIRKMNARARELGLDHTHFTSPHGLDARGHYSTPKDLATLAQLVMKKPEFRRIVKLRQVRIAPSRGRKRVLKSTDELLGRYAGLKGVKTGFTGRAKYCFVGYAERNGVSLYSVVLGTASNAARFAQTRRLLDWGFKHMKPQKLTIGPAGVARTAADPQKGISARFEQRVSVPVFDLDGAIGRKSALATNVALPVFKGQPLGSVTFMQGRRSLATVKVVSARAVSSVNETVGAVPVNDYVDRSVVVRAGDSSWVPVFDPKRPVQRQVVLPSKITAPVTLRQRLGEIVYSQDGHVIVRVPAVAGEAVPAPGPLARLGISLIRGWRTVFGGPMVSPVVEARS